MHGDAAWAKYERAAWILYLGCVTVSGFAGAGIGRAILALALVSLIVAWTRGRRHPFMTPTAWWALAWLGLAVASTLLSPHRALGVGALHKLLPWLQIPVALALVNSEPRLRHVVVAWTAGCCILALLTLGQSAGALFEGHAAGRPLLAEGSIARLLEHRQLQGQDTLAVIIARGDMQDGQRLATAVVAVLALLLFGERGIKPRARTLTWMTLPLLTSALLLTFKRGAILTMLSVSGTLVLLRLVTRFPRGRGRLTATLGLLPAAAMATLLVACVVLVPRSPALIARTEASARVGGRTCMWTRITPTLVAQHPWLGRGFKTLRHEDMRAIFSRVEPRQTHVHATVLQVAIDTGLLGASVFLVWIATTSRRAWRLAGEALNAPRVAMAAMLLVLLLCGLVEFQLGSAQVVLAYGMIMGSLGRLTPPMAAPPGPGP